jgi:hypothetical protein
MSPASDGRSIQDVFFGPWMKPMGALIYFHQWIDQELVVLIWLIKARKEALRRGKWPTERRNPSAVGGGGGRINQFAQSARAGFDAFEDARITIDQLVEDLGEANNFRNTLVHGRWAGHAEGRLTVFDSNLVGDQKWIRVTPEELEACGRNAFELILRLRKFYGWVQEQNAEVTRRLARRSIIRLLRARAGLPQRGRAGVR